MDQAQSGLVALTGHGAWSSQAPKTIRIIVPYLLGSGPDILSRLLGQHISQDGGTAIVVENRPGGGTVTGTGMAVRAAPDCGTLLLAGRPSSSTTRCSCRATSGVRLRAGLPVRGNAPDPRGQVRLPLQDV